MNRKELKEHKEGQVKIIGETYVKPDTEKKRGENQKWEKLGS